MSGGFFRSTTLVGGLTLLSRISGLLRDMVYSRLFGAGVLMDAFLVAFKIPNFLRRLFAEGAFSQAFVPVVSEYRVRRSHEEVRQLVDGVAGTFGTFLAVLTTVGVVAAPLLILLFAPGFRDDAGRFALAADMLRWTFPYIFFVSLTALAGGVLNSYGRFGIPAFTPILLNLVMILFAGWLAPSSSDPGAVLAMGVFVAGLIQLALQLPPMWRLGLIRRPRWHWAHEGVRRIGRLMLPAIFGSSVAQVSLLLDTLIASFLATGSITWLYYADRLVEFPLGVFSIALATVILPGLSSHHAEQSRERFSATLDWALKLVCLIVAPAAVALFVLAGPLTVAIFQYGEFTPLDARMATFALMAYAIGLLGFSLVKVLAPGYFARQDTRTPVRTGVQALSLTMTLNLLFLAFGAWQGLLAVQGLHVFLAASTGLGALVNCAMLYRGLRRLGVLVHGPGWGALMMRVLAANVAMVAFLLAVTGDLEDWFAMAAIERIARMAVCVLGGAGVYFTALGALGARPAQFRMRPPTARPGSV